VSSLYRSKICATVFLVFVCQLSLKAQQSTTPGPPAQQAAPVAWLDHYRISTISVGRISTHTNTQRQFFEVIGTALFVAVDQHAGYIVTAKHVFYEPEKNWHPTEVRLRFAWQEDKSLFDETGVTLTLRDADGKDLWKALDDGSDLAAIVPPADIKNSSPHAIWVTDFATDADLFMGASVVVLGYPGVVGNEYLVRPILRQGIVAWTNPIDPMKQIFMVDANVYPGNSGSPVFKIPIGPTKGGGLSMGGQIASLGILSKVPFQDDPVLVDGQPLILTPPVGQLPANHPVRVQVVGVGGIGIIEPASKVLTLVQSFQTNKTP
jgi:hypothetical protein